MTLSFVEGPLPTFSKIGAGDRGSHTQDGLAKKLLRVGSVCRLVGRR
jgi:hypothetical protein